ncbi:MAG: hypothetical protein OJF51_002367 [Nitrospira sp.]|nr:MAG: hypothetical protein OJF51_002367 [Nitrospira sp.]
MDLAPVHKRDVIILRVADLTAASLNDPSNIRGLQPQGAGLS